MARCKQCGEETLHDYHELCIKCYKHGVSNPHPISKEGSNGLTDKEHFFRFNMIKGRIAETLIEELFLSLGYNVFRYGMENTVPGIVDLLRGVRSDVANDIRLMPDFVVQKGDKVYFLEVKYRGSEEFRLDDLSPNYPYENTYFIIVSRAHIKCISYWELKAGMEVSPSSQNYLGNRKEFALDRQTIIEFCDFATAFFQNA